MLLPHTDRELAALIDQTNLKPGATRAEMTAYLQDVRAQGYASAAILPVWTELAAGILAGSGIAVDPAIGFPFGANPTTAKVAEVRWCLERSRERTEFDMVMALGLFKSGEYQAVLEDIRAVVQAAGGCVVKVIIETPVLSPQEIVFASRLVEEGGAQFVKTSTGNRGLAQYRSSTPEDVRLIRSAVSSSMKVKIAGGMTGWAVARAGLEAGADRIGSAFGSTILDEFRAAQA
jgi:deoxyribose-phosphate aldolase